MGKISQLFKSKAARDYGFTLGVEMFVVLATVYSLRLASTNFGKEEYAEYVVFRRILSTLLPFFILGLGVAIPRFVAMAVNGSTLHKAGSYLYASLWLIIWPIVIIIIATLAIPEQISFLFFGSKKFSELILPIGLILIGGILHNINYGFFRGTLHMSKANMIQFINMGIVPLIVFFVASSCYEVVLYMALAWIGISVVVLLIQVSGVKYDREDVKKSLREIFIYGIARVPGDFLLGVFLNLPVTMVTHSDGLLMSGYVGTAIIIFGMTGAVFAPICLMLLTDASQLLVKNDFEGLKRRISLVLKVTVLLTLVGIILVELLAPFITHTILSVEGDIVVKCSRIVILASLGYTIYVSLRSVLDAYYVKPVNTINIAISMTLFGGLSILYRYFDLDYVYIMICFIASMFLLGGLTLFETKKVLDRNLKHKI